MTRLLHDNSRLLLALAVIATASLLTAGCLGTDSSSTTPTTNDNPPDNDNPSNNGTTPKNGTDTVTLEHTYEGYLLYRSGISGPLPEAQWEGDPPGFCFNVPENTTRLEGEYTWDTPQPMMLKLAGPNRTGDRSWDHTKVWTGFNNVTPPIRLDIDTIEPGTWYAYAGPFASGGATEWSLTLTWTVQRGDATLDETKYDGDPCGV